MWNLDELDKLEQYLKDNGYEYIRYDDTAFGNRVEGYHQIYVIKNGKRWWDAICHRPPISSYGNTAGLLEIMGNDLLIDKRNTVEGWLTAQNIIDRLETLHGNNH